MSRLHRLSALGQSVWIDYLSRDLLESRGLARAFDEDAVVGVTSNPTIFDKALSGGVAYDAQIAAAEGDTKSVFLGLASADVAAACNLLQPVWEQTGGRDGYVSIEVDPNLAHDAEATIAEATKLHAAIERPNLLVKIPATETGLRAIEEMTARGRSINVTLIFSLTRHGQVIEAYLRGLERLVAGGGDPRHVHSVASFFVSRVDAEADRRLAAIGREDLKGRLGIANAKLAYQQYKELFSGERWHALAARGATKQRCLWASTSTKDPAYRDTLYVEELIGPETISTMPEETIRAFQQHGRVAATLERGADESRSLLAELAAAGIDYEDVVATLEREGIDKFVASFDRLLERLAQKRSVARERRQARQPALPQAIELYERSAHASRSAFDDGRPAGVTSSPSPLEGHLDDVAVCTADSAAVTSFPQHLPHSLRIVGRRRAQPAEGTGRVGVARR